MGRLNKYADLAANVTTVIACAALVTFLYQKSTTLRTQPRPQSPPQYQIGESVQLPNVDFAAARKTLVLYFHSSCRYCTDSMPFYRKLRARQATQAGRVQFTGVSPEPLPTALSYLQMNSVSMDRVISVQRAQIKIRGTPTLLLLDGGGRVIKVWRGQLATAIETEVQSEVFGTGA